MSLVRDTAIRQVLCPLVVFRTEDFSFWSIAKEVYLPKFYEGGRFLIV